jgi:hypothetical protein
MKPNMLNVLKDLVTPNISACRNIDNTLLIKALLFHGKGATSLRVYFVNASAKTHTVKSIKFRPHLVM